tara:strand:- start:654 stop:1739 length:1086 start_codon:yes stop_codon:yes gene_type:complete
MIDLSRVSIDDNERKAVLRVLDSGWFINGKETELFEQHFAAFVNTKYAIACSNGMAAIFISLIGLDIGHGDEVIVPSHTAFPTVLPVLNVNAKPVFADINEKTYTLDPEQVKKTITEKTKAVIAVHLYGHPADIDSISHLCKDNGISLIEDACQAHGAKYKGDFVGSFGDVGCFSFYPSKNMTSCGDGGIITTNNKNLYEKAKMLLNLGCKDRYNHEIQGYNFRISEFSCAIANEQLKKLPAFNQRRKEIADKYSKLLSGSEVILPGEKDWAQHVYHLYVIRSKKRGALKKYLEASGIKAEIHYPIPCHKQKAVIQKDAEQLPVTEKIIHEILSLPMHPQLKNDELEFIAEKVTDFEKLPC